MDKDKVARELVEEIVNDLLITGYEKIQPLRDSSVNRIMEIITQAQTEILDLAIERVESRKVNRQKLDGSNQENWGMEYQQDIDWCVNIVNRHLDREVDSLRKLKADLIKPPAETESV